MRSPLDLLLFTRRQQHGLLRLVQEQTRTLSRLEKKLGVLMADNDEVREQIAQLRGTNDRLVTTLEGVSSDVRDLIARVEALPGGETLTEETKAELRDAVAAIARTTDAFEAQDASYPPPPVGL